MGVRIHPLKHPKRIHLMPTTLVCGEANLRLIVQYGRGYGRSYFEEKFYRN
jgi:hypothetical protein